MNKTKQEINSDFTKSHQAKYKDLSKSLSNLPKTKNVRSGKSIH